MADIFISYASEDRSRAEPIAKALEEQGWSVWWDRKIPPGKTFAQVIEEAINAAKCVIVLWSNESVKSDWVQNEAAEGARKGILVPALIDDVQIPFEFRRIQAADLTEWKAETGHHVFTILQSAISEIVGPSPLKVTESEEKRAEEERRRKQGQQRKLREQEQSKAYEEHKRRENEAKRKAEEEQLRKEKEELELKFEEEERKRRGLKAEIKPDKQEPTTVKTPGPEHETKPTIEPVSPEPRKTSKVLKLGALAIAAVLVIVGILRYSAKNAKLGEVIVEVIPRNATVNILKIDKDFKQGMRLEPGKYELELAADGYETERQWIDLTAGHKNPFRFELSEVPIFDQAHFGKSKFK